tara:strand:+ start:14850 stop:15473 length:624 start_codon:yes stop_codon:yes gene_type:complete
VPHHESNQIVVAVTGGSGAGYARRLVRVLLEAGRDVHLTMSAAAVQVFAQELDCILDLKQFDPEAFFGPEFSPELLDRFQYHNQFDFSAGIASGSFRTAGMVICPCSMGTLGSLANGLSANLTHRVADVHLKERRKLIVVPRETPLSSIQLGNMKRLADAGAVILPAMPGFYHDPKSIDDLINFIVVRICDHLGVETSLMKRWGEKS